MTCTCGHKIITHTSRGLCVLCACPRFYEAPLSSSPTLKEIDGWAPNYLASRLIADIYEQLPLSSSEISKLQSIQAKAGYMSILDGEVEWLASLVWRYQGSEYLYGVLARFWEYRSLSKTGTTNRRAWCWIRAASFWRKIEQLGRAHLCLEQITKTQDERLRAVVLTVRAAVLLDQGELKRSAADAHKAILLQPDAPHPYNVLGAICVKLGQLDAAGNYFTQAETRGEIGSNKEYLQGILNAMSPGDRKELAQFLLNRHPIKRWLEPYIN